MEEVFEGTRGNIDHGIGPSENIRTTCFVGQRSKGNGAHNISGIEAKKIWTTCENSVNSLIFWNFPKQRNVRSKMNAQQLMPGKSYD